MKTKSLAFGKNWRQNKLLLRFSVLYYKVILKSDNRTMFGHMKFRFKKYLHIKVYFYRTQERLLMKKIIENIAILVIFQHFVAK